MNILGVIPARYKSTRFPGKPLVDISGRPMIWWVYKHCVDANIFTDVIVATDDERILQSCKTHKIKAIITSESNQTGMDRMGEVALSIKADMYVDIQGDEPLLEPETIAKAVMPVIENPSIQVTNLMTKITNPSDIINSTIPKVVTCSDGRCVFLSRSPIPYPKGSLEVPYYKQVCVYGVSPTALGLFYNYGKKFGKSSLEQIEDIELLRFIELDIPVHFIEVESNTIAVDTPKDLEKVRKTLAL